MLPGDPGCRALCRTRAGLRAKTDFGEEVAATVAEGVQLCVLDNVLHAAWFVAQKNEAGAPPIFNACLGFCSLPFEGVAWVLDCVLIREKQRPDDHGFPGHKHPPALAESCSRSPSASAWLSVSPS